MGKQITQFDVFNAMPEGSIDVFINTAGGKQVGRGKNQNAIIEVLVDNDTFQDFAFQKSYGHAKTGKKKKYFVMYVCNADLFEKTRELLQSKKNKNHETNTPG